MGLRLAQELAVCRVSSPGYVVGGETKSTGYFLGRHIWSDPVWPGGLGAGSRRSATLESRDREYAPWILHYALIDADQRPVGLLPVISVSKDVW
jgi:hypothetical protein